MKHEFQFAAIVRLNQSLKKLLTPRIFIENKTVNKWTIRSIDTVLVLCALYFARMGYINRELLKKGASSTCTLVKNRITQVCSAHPKKSAVSAILGFLVAYAVFHDETYYVQDSDDEDHLKRNLNRNPGGILRFGFVKKG